MLHTKTAICGDRLAHNCHCVCMYAKSISVPQSATLTLPAGVLQVVSAHGGMMLFLCRQVTKARRSGVGADPPSRALSVTDTSTNHLLMGSFQGPRRHPSIGGVSDHHPRCPSSASSRRLRGKSAGRLLLSPRGDAVCDLTCGRGPSVHGGATCIFRDESRDGSATRVSSGDSSCGRRLSQIAAQGAGPYSLPISDTC